MFTKAGLSSGVQDLGRGLLRCAVSRRHGESFIAFVKSWGAGLYYAPFRDQSGALTEPTGLSVVCSPGDWGWCLFNPVVFKFGVFIWSY